MIGDDECLVQLNRNEIQINILCLLCISTPVLNDEVCIATCVVLVVCPSVDMPNPWISWICVHISCLNGCGFTNIYGSRSSFMIHRGIEFSIETNIYDRDGKIPVV